MFDKSKNILNTKNAGAEIRIQIYLDTENKKIAPTYGKVEAI